MIVKYEGRLLSVIVPVYGVEAYLEECIQSILDQTYCNLEIILVDDGANGREPEICDQYVEKDNRIQVIHKENEGLVAARKSGLEKATGEYVAFVDGDDFLQPDYYERMMKIVEDVEPDLVAVGITKTYEDGKEEQIIQSIADGTYEGDQLMTLFRNMNCVNGTFYEPGIFPSTCLKIYRRDLLEKILATVPNTIRMGEDAAITYPYLLNCHKVAVASSICGYYYRMVPDSMTTRADASLFTGSSALYAHLFPYYQVASDECIQEQLEYYRAYLMYLAINYWMAGVKPANVHGKVAEMRKLAEGTELFSHLERMLDLVLPRSLSVYIRLLLKSRWKAFEMVLFVRAVRGS